jgi:acetyl coenzyme A synthetase (ADP forming)-like protein
VLERPSPGEGVEVFFRPRGVAVIGAAREPGKVGHMVLRNLKESFPGPVYPVNPRAREVLGLPAYPSILDVPDPVDLAVVAVPARIVPRVVEQAGRRGVRGVIVLSAGFREVGGEGVRLERELVGIVRRYGMRMVGPNCIGVYSPSTGVNATFFDSSRQGFPGPGPVAFVSQSGALGAAVLDWAEAREVGVSRFVSLGNKADVDEADMLAYLRGDEETWSIALYVEGVEDGARFRRALEETTPVKPVVVLKAGRSEAGARAAASHTGSLAGSYRVYMAVFRQTGVVPADSPDEMYGLAMGLALQPPMLGRRVGVVTVGGGSGVMASDWLSELGLEVPRLSEETQARLRRVLLPIASPRNPVDVTGSATDEHLLEATRIVAESGEVDGILLIPYFNLAGITPELPAKMAQLVRELRRSGHMVPIIASVTGGRKAWSLALRLEKEAGIPVYTSEAAAAKALWALSRYGRWVEKKGTMEEHLRRHAARALARTGGGHRGEEG